MKLIKRSLPFILLFSLVGLLYHQLFYNHTTTLPSALIGQTLPQFSLPSLAEPDKKVTKEQVIGRPLLINVWASWCDACALEMPMLLNINKNYNITLIGIDYKDNPHEAQKWLAQNGNPYQLVLSDRQGDLAIDLGIYGTPETFVVNAHGEILYRHIGILDEETWQKKIWPLVQKS